jgi:transcriptional regulator GlxA family with amidase domain
MSAPRTIGVLLFDDVEELDAAGPWEVLGYWTRTYPRDGWRVVSLARKQGLVTAAHGLRIHADHGFSDAPELDVLVYPGGQGTRAHLRDEVRLRQLQAWATRAEIVASVCTGALVLAAAGLLRNRRATTHWQSLDTLAELEPTATVLRDQRFVDEGDVVTSAGVSAGVDMALHLVERLAGPERRLAVSREIEW